MFILNINYLILQLKNQILQHTIMSVSKGIDLLENWIILLLENSAEMERYKISTRFSHS